MLLPSLLSVFISCLPVSPNFISPSFSLSPHPASDLSAMMTIKAGPVVPVGLLLSCLRFRCTAASSLAWSR